MKIAVCIKRVPATETQAKIAAGGTSLEPSGVEYMLSFYDDIAVEQAIRTKEQHGGEVTVLTLGPAAATKEVRECLAKGADKGVVLRDEDWASNDCRATATVLADKLRELEVELVFTGRLATDRDNAAVGPMIATMLDWACVTDAIEVEIGAAGKCTAKREADGGIEAFEFSLPAVVTCQKDLNAPRYAGLKGIMAAKKKPLEEVEVARAQSQTQVVAVALPPARAAGRIVGKGPDAVASLIDALRNEARVL